MHGKQRTGKVIQSVLVAFLTVLVFRLYFDIAYVSGESMEPVFYEGEILLLKKWGMPQKGDIVTAYIDEREDIVVKRILAGEGGCITVDDGKIYLNGEKASEPVCGIMEGSRKQEYILLSEQYFLIGENLEVSLDSRVFGCIEKRDINGIVVCKLF